MSLHAGLREKNARYDGFAERSHHVGQKASELQLLQQEQRLLWQLALLARADGRVVGDYVWQEASELQLPQQLQRLLWLLALLARADGRAVGDHVRQEASELQLLQ